MSDQEKHLPLYGLVYEDAELMIEIIDKFASHGVDGEELFPVGVLRMRLKETMKRSKEQFNETHRRVRQETSDPVGIQQGSQEDHDSGPAVDGAV